MNKRITRAQFSQELHQNDKTKKNNALTDTHTHTLQQKHVGTLFKKNEYAFQTNKKSEGDGCLHEKPCNLKCDTPMALHHALFRALHPFRKRGIAPLNCEGIAPNNT